MLKDVNVLGAGEHLPLVSCINYYRMKEISVVGLNLLI